MKLTVGPLPASVYWRRRAAVLGVLLLVVLGMVAIFNGGGRKQPTSGGSGPGGAGGTPTATAGGLTPSDGGQPGGASTGASGGPAGQVAAGTTGATGATASNTCADADMRLTPSTDPAIPRVGVSVTVILKIRNVSDRTCVRDVGSGPQELRISSGSTVLWSSDYCQAGKGGHYIRTFPPGYEATFYVTWDGYPTAPGCVHASEKPVQPGTYQLQARLDTELSSPVNLVIQGNPS